MKPTAVRRKNSECTKKYEGWRRGKASQITRTLTKQQILQTETSEKTESGRKKQIRITNLTFYGKKVLSLQPP